MALEKPLRMNHPEGIAQIFHSLVSIQSSLGRGVAGAMQTAQHRRVGSSAQLIREQISLIEAALAKPCGMQRNRNQKIGRLELQPIIFQSFAEPFAERDPQVALTIVLKAMDELADYSATEVRRDRATEMQLAICAVAADKTSRNRAGERLGTTLAKRRHDAAHVFPAPGAQVRAALGADAAVRAVRRKEK